MWEGEYPDDLWIKTWSCVFLLKLDYLRGKLLWRIYGLIIPSNKVSVGFFVPIVAFLDQSSRLALELWAQRSGKTDVSAEHKEDKAGGSWV